jgi:acetate kinase
MSEIILSVNAGSSSLKISVYKSKSGEQEDPIELAVCTIEGLTASPVQLKYSRPGAEPVKKETPDIHNHGDAFKAILDQLFNDEGLKEVKRKEDITYAVHRVVHGGEFSKPTLINEDTLEQMEGLSDLAPL